MVACITRALFDTRFNDVSPFEARLATDFRDSDGWQPVLADGASATATGDTGSANYAAFIGELSGCELDILRDGATVTTIFETLSVVFFPQQTGEWSFRVRNTTGSEQTPFVAVVMAGLYLDIPAQELGFTSPMLSRDVRQLSNVSELGRFLGRSVRRVANTFTIRARLMDSDYAHGSWYTLLKHAELRPFWFYQDIGYREDVAWCWSDQERLEGAVYSNYRRLDQAIPVRGIVREGISTLPTLQPSFSISDASGLEDAGTLTFTITRAGDVTGAASVDWATQDATATAGTDYTAANGTANFIDGQSEVQVSVSINDDSLQNGARFFRVNLSNSSGPAIIRPVGIGTILDDEGIDVPPGQVVVYYGVSQNAQLSDPAPLQDATQAGYKQTRTFNATGGNYLYFGWPVSVGGANATFLVSGLPTSFGRDTGSGYEPGTPLVTQVNGTDYYIWRSENIVNGASITVQVQ